MSGSRTKGLMHELKKKIGKVLASKSVGTGPSSYEKRIYRAAVSQRLRNTCIEILVTLVKCFRFKQLAPYRMVRSYSFENESIWLPFAEGWECENILHTSHRLRNYLYNLYNVELHLCFATICWPLFGIPALSFISTYGPGQINFPLYERKKVDRAGRRYGTARGYWLSLIILNNRHLEEYYYHWRLGSQALFKSLY